MAERMSLDYAHVVIPNERWVNIALNQWHTRRTLGCQTPNKQPNLTLVGRRSRLALKQTGQVRINSSKNITNNDALP
jgi:hypothetical protein